MVIPTPQRDDAAHGIGLDGKCAVCGPVTSTPEAATERCEHGRDVAHYVTYGADKLPTSWCPGPSSTNPYAASGLQRATEQQVDRRSEGFGLRSE